MSDHHTPLGGLNLNLLLTLRVLLREVSVTRAAEILRQSQPTVSRSLSTLRVAFEDPLLVRSGRGMMLTPLGESLLHPLERSIASLDRLKGLGSFSPQHAERTFRIVMPDIVGTCIFVPLAKIFARTEGLTLQVMGEERNILRGLINDEFDLALIGLPPEHPELHCRKFRSSEKFYVVAGQAHPAWEEEEMSLEAWLDSDHVRLIPGHNPGLPGILDLALSELGHTRRVRVEVAYVSVLRELLEELPLVISLPAPLAWWLAGESDKIRVWSHPLKEGLPEISLKLVWHGAHQQDAGHKWLRRTIAEIVTSQPGWGGG